MLLYLISQVEREDVPKIEYIYKRYHGEMIRLAKSRLKHSDIKTCDADAEDVVQNAFLKICKYIKKIDFSVAEKELRAYVLSIVANEVNNFILDYKYVETLDEGRAELSDSDFFERICIREHYNDVVGIIERMDEKYSITLLYRYHNGFSVKQIAELVGIPKKTVYTRLERGKRLLIKALEEMERV